MFQRHSEFNMRHCEIAHRLDDSLGELIPRQPSPSRQLPCSQGKLVEELLLARIEVGHVLSRMRQSFELCLRSLDAIQHLGDRGTIFPLEITQEEKALLDRFHAPGIKLQCITV